MSVIATNLPPDIDFKRDCPTLGFSLSAPTAKTKNEAASWTAGLKKSSQAFWVLIGILFSFSFLNPLSSTWNCFGVNVICFWQLHLLLEHLSCNLRKSPLLFKSHHAELDFGEQCPCLHFPFLAKVCLLFIHLVKICDLFHPQLSHFPFMTLKTFLFWELFFHIPLYSFQTSCVNLPSKRSVLIPISTKKLK